VPKLKRLSGKDVIAILGRFGFVVVSQRGSHVKLARVLSSGERQILTVPNHSELDTGTCRALFRQAGRYVLEQELRPHFYSE
jgi:predicted RNA binding protein YcfA (HicA-like mRNA interferase family)